MVKSHLNQESKKKQFIITKKIAKHGSQSIIVTPRMLEQHLKPGTVMQLTIDVIDDLKNLENDSNDVDSNNKLEVNDDD